MISRTCSGPEIFIEIAAISNFGTGDEPLPDATPADEVITQAVGVLVGVTVGVLVGVKVGVIVGVFVVVLVGEFVGVAVKV